MGMFKESKKSGDGIFILPDGGKYIGNFEEDKMNGKGTFTFSNGSVYYGDFINGVSHG